MHTNLLVIFRADLHEMQVAQELIRYFAFVKRFTEDGSMSKIMLCN
jgi:hypothetical protein